MKALASICLFLTWPLAAAAPQVTLSVSTPTATIGERIELRVVVRADASSNGIRIDIPADAFEVVNRRLQPTVQAAGGKTFEEIITIAFFKTGDFNIGPFAVELLPRRGQPNPELTGKLAIRIRSLLTESDRDIKPLKRPLEMGGDPKHLLPYAAGIMMLLLLGILAWFLLKKTKSMRLAETAPLLPPEIELEMRIQELRQKNLLQRGEGRQFFIALSDMIKHFIQRAYEFNAADFTTTETVAQLKHSEKDEAIVADMAVVFQQADLVKFARQVPEKEAEASVFEKIVVVIEKHKKRRETAVAEAHV